MQLSMTAFEERLRAKARRERAPVACIFEITPTCNLRCQFCYVALDPYKGPYLSTAQICRVLDKLAAAEVLWLVLTGGEIFSRRDFPQIYAYAQSKGFLVTLFTNATMVSEKVADLLRANPPHSVEVSIYGADRAHYEETTQIPGSFERFERGVRRLMDAGVRLVMKTPLSQLTEDHIPALIDWCRARGLPFKLDPSMDARHDGGQQPKVFRIAPRGVKRVLAEIDALNGLPPAPPPLPDCAEKPAPGEQLEQLYQCGAGRTSLFVDALGMASHCVIDRDPAFPLLEMDFGDVWARIGDWVTQPLPKGAPCSGCTLRQGCSNCPARSRLANGSPYLKDPYYCDITHVEHGLEPERHPARYTARRSLAACAV